MPLNERIRAKAIAVENTPHDLGVFWIARAVGSVPKVLRRTWQVAEHLKNTRGRLEGDSYFDDHNRLRCYAIKYHRQPGHHPGIDHVGGFVEEAKSKTRCRGVPGPSHSNQTSCPRAAPPLFGALPFHDPPAHDALTPPEC